VSTEERAAAPQTKVTGQSPAPPWVDPALDRNLLLVAIVVTLAISRLPEIVLRDILGLDVAWYDWAIVALAAALWFASRLLDFLRPLERYLAVMAAIALALALLPVVFESAPWRSLVPETSQAMVQILATRIVFALVALAIVGWTLALGASRQEAYLVVGELNAPTRTRRGNGYLGWGTFGPIALFGLMLLMVWFATPQLPASIDIGAALPYIAIGALCALLNAFWEEAAFRAAPLAMLQRAVGPGAGVIILALWFGLGHYYGGIPSGPTALLAVSLLGLLFGRAMIETRGFVWPLALHFGADLVIFTFLAIASVA